jgi:hypothetical protein
MVENTGNAAFFLSNFGKFRYKVRTANMWHFLRGKGMIRKFAIACVVTACATGAQATTLDFLGMANAGEQAVESPPSINPILNAFVPIATTAIGFKGFSGDVPADLIDAGAWAYLDGNSAGMGVCSTGVDAARQCTTPSDDNIQEGEVLALSWGQDLRIDTLSFRGEGHPNEPNFTADEFFDVSFDSGATWLSFGLINAQFGSVTVNGFVKAGASMLLTTSAQGNHEQFYLSAAEVNATTGGPSPVPLPASALLLLSAVGGIAAFKRRRRAA